MGRIHQDALEIKAEKFLSSFWKEIRRDFISMINWLLFYKPKDKLDKIWHTIEVVLAWVIIIRAFN